MVGIKFIRIKGNLFIMLNKYSSYLNRLVHLLGLMFVFSFLFLTSCNNDDCVIPECRTNLDNNTIVVVTGDVSGGEGTQITPDIIDSLSITNQSAVVKFSVLKLGRCHKVLGYGHTWSSNSGTPIIGSDNFVDYENNINFNDEVVTLMNGLSPQTKYWVRSWIAIEKQDCGLERIIFYNDKISEFTTL